MFDDDIWYPNALAVLVDALETHPNWDMTYGNVIVALPGRRRHRRA